MIIVSNSFALYQYYVTEAFIHDSKLIILLLLASKRMEIGTIYIYILCSHGRLIECEEGARRGRILKLHRRNVCLFVLGN